MESAVESPAEAPERPVEARPPAWRAWLEASRPKTLGAAFAPVAVGTALAHEAGAAQPLAALAALGGAGAIQIGTNLFNDYEDFRRGADTEERLGPARATQKGWLSPRAVLTGSIAAFALAFAFGVYLVWLAGWPIVILGLASIACGFLYTGGPYPLAYTGAADLFVVIFFGFAAVGGTYYIQTGALTPQVAIAALAVGSLVTAILVVNNLRDRVTDAAAGKRTLVVRFGPRFARWEYASLVFGPYVAVAAAWAAGLGGIGWGLPWLSLPLAISEFLAICQSDGAALNPRLGTTARLAVIFSLLLSVGVLLP